MITVLIPWRAQASRIEAFDRVTTWYRETLPGVDIRPVDSIDSVFNLAMARNAGIRSIADPDVVVVIGDADTLPQAGPLLAAVEAARSSGRVHLPYREYRWLGPEGSRQFAGGAALIECDFELVRGACSGVYVTTPRTWWAHGGQDERFRGWGFEDAAWNVAHGTLLGDPPQRHAGTVFALHHVAERRDGPHYDANAALMERYRAAASDPEAMRALVGRSADAAS